MYLFYENHKAADGSVLATDVIHSSNKNGIGINWRSSDSPMHEVLLRFYKSIHTANRSFNSTTKVWTFLGSSGNNLITLLKASPALASIVYEEVEDLSAQIASGGIKPQRKKIDPTKFFYNYTTVAAPALTRSSVIAPLSKLLEVEADWLEKAEKTEAKKIYRKACLKYHPDRNNGDGSRMSDLNMYWSVYYA